MSSTHAESLSDPSHLPENVVPHNTALQRAVLLTQKELRETLRDRRTIITLLAMPLMLYPLLGMGFRFMAVSQLKASSAPQYTIVVNTEVEALWLKMAMNAGQETLRQIRANTADTVVEDQSMQKSRLSSPTTSDRESELLPSASDLHPPEPKLQIASAKDPNTFDLVGAVRALDADVGVRVHLDEWNGRVTALQKAQIDLISCRDSATSREAIRYLQECLSAANLYAMTRVAQEQDPSAGVPVRMNFEVVTSGQRSRGFLGLLPLVLLLMTVTGGVYPAIDLTAGERERDTLETLVSLPISRVNLLLGKYVAVFTVTMLTGIVNLTAMTATVYALKMETQLFGESGITLQLALSLGGILVVFGLFYSAVLLALTSSSRSFKEAQAYLIPLMLMSIAPGLSILIPGWHLQGFVTVLPLVNMLLLARDVFEGTVQYLPASIAVVSTLMYAGAALSVAARVFGTDAIAVGSRGSWSDLFRRPDATGASLDFGTAFGTLAMLFPLYFFASGVLSRTANEDPRLRLVTSGVLTILLFGVVPGLVLWWKRISPVAGWQLNFARWFIWPAALLLGLSAWPLVYELVLMTQQFGIAAIDPERLKLVSEMLEKWRSVPLPLMVFALGVLPGVFEELFFRGFLFGAMRRSMKAPSAIVLCGLLFGIFHVVAAEGATLERLLPSATLGCLLSWVAYRTNSVLPGMLLHVLHNSTLLTIAHFRDDLAALTVGNAQQQHLPGSWLVTSAIAVMTGLIWIRLATRTGERSRNSDSLDGTGSGQRQIP